MKKLFLILVVALMTILISFCYSTEEEDDNTLLLLVLTSITELEGTWQGSCTDISGFGPAVQVFNGNGSIAKNTYSLGGVTYTTTYYSSTDCSGNQLGTEVTTTSYGLDGNTEVSGQTVGRIRTFTSLSATTQVTPTHTDAVTHANANSGYSQTGWQLNVSKSVSSMLMYDGSDTSSTWQTLLDSGWDGWYRTYYQLSPDKTTLTRYAPTSINTDNTYPATLGGVSNDYTKQ